MKRLLYNRIIPVLCLLPVLFILCLSFSASAEENDTEPETQNIVETETTAYFDYSDDPALYAERVAALNRGELPLQDEEPDPGKKTTNNAKLQSRQTLVAVLCRTNVDEFDFSPWEPVYVLAGPKNRFTLYFSGEEAADQAVRELSELETIRYAERDREVEACSGEDLSFHSWGAARMNFGQYLPYSAHCAAGSVTVAVIDSGCYLHPMYASRVVSGGYDYVDGDYDTTNDEFGHGTAVTGIVYECTQMLPVYLYPIRTLNANGGGSVTNLVNAIDEAVRKGVQVINLSLVADSISSALDDAILDALGDGVTVVAAAGNKNADTSLYSPAHLSDSGVIVVGSGETTGRRASYSNYGTSVDLYTYGTAISCCSTTGEYKNSSGTSMAAPHVAGLAAVLSLTHSGIQPAEIETRIVNSTDVTKEVNLPDLLRILPQDHGFYLTGLKMGMQDHYQLYTEIRPLTALEPIRYSSSNETVLRVSDGSLIPVAPGETTVTAECLGLDDIVFRVQVDENESVSAVIPQTVKSLGDEAFYADTSIIHVVLPIGAESLGENVFGGCANLRTVDIPETVTEIGENDFSGAVILCHQGSTAETYAKENNLNYILNSN